MKIHPINPEERKLKVCIKHLHDHGVLAFPTQCGYQLLAHMGSKKALELLRHLRQVDKHHLFSMMALDIKQIAPYVHYTTPIYRFLKKEAYTPTTFIVKASKEVPKLLLHPKRKELGVRFAMDEPSHLLLKLLGEPVLAVGLLSEQEGEGQYGALTASHVTESMGHPKLLVVESEPCAYVQTRIYDCTQDEIRLLREGTY